MVLPSTPVTGAGTGTVTLRGPNNAAVAAAVGYNAANRTVTLNPNANLAAGIRDASGNPLAAASWSFTTEAGPAITGRTPAVNATNVAANGNITVTFS